MKKEKESVFDEVVDTIEIKGKKYSVYQGKKGGKYYYNDNGKKTYIKEAKTPKVNKIEKTIDLRKPVTDEPKKYIGYFAQLDGGQRVDDFKEWCEARNESEARQIFEERYSGSIARGTIELSMIWEE